MPKISFVMPAKDRGKMIKKSIQTIINQTIKDWELIVVDDHSKKGDQTKKVVASFRDPRIKYIRMPDSFPGGIPATRNFGNMFASAPIIAVADSDDLFYPQRAALTIKAFAKEKCDVFYGRYDVLYQNKKELQERKIIPFDLTKMKKHNLIANGSSAYKREFAYEYPYNSFFRKASDYDFFTRLAIAGKKFYFCDQKIYTYVLHDNNISQGKSAIVFDQLIFLNRKWIKANRDEIVRQIILNN